MSETLSFPFEREAMRGDMLPDGLSLHDQMAYVCLRTLYHDYHEKRLDRDAASAEKRKILGAWRMAKGSAEFEDKLTSYYAQLHIRTERAMAEVRKDPTPEKAIKLCDVIGGMERYWPEETWTAPPVDGAAGSR